MSPFAGEPPLPPDMRVPDDARELDDDLRALQREEREAARARLRPDRRRAPSMPFLAFTALSLACLVALGQLFMVRERPRQLAAGAPLRSAPAELTGKPGGLLPDVSLIARPGSISARSLRPAVLMVVAPGCDCAEKVRHVVSQTAPHPVRLFLVGSRPQVTDLAAAAGAGVVLLADDTGVLQRTYRGEASVVLVLVRDDGTVSEIIDGVATSLRLDAPIRRMLQSSPP